MQHALAALHAGLERGEIADVAGPALEGQIGDAISLARAAHQAAHLMALSDQLSDHHRTNEAVATCDEEFHTFSLRVPAGPLSDRSVFAGFFRKTLTDEARRKSKQTDMNAPSLLRIVEVGQDKKRLAEFIAFPRKRIYVDKSSPWASPLD